MSDQPPRARRTALRIMPIAPVDSAGAAQRTANVFKPSPARPVVRSRAYGAPLIAGSRPPAAKHVPRDRASVDGLESATTNLVANSGTLAVGRTPSPAPSATDQEAVAQVVLWEQPPQPESDIDENDLLPPWVGDVSLSPTEAQFHDLGSYLSFMALGFADFCRSEYIVDTGEWQGRMPMPQKILPETVLQLEVSTFHAKLRFETDHPVSREILKRNCDRLRDQVAAALEDSRPVEVSIW